MMGIVVPETCWAYKKYNKIINGVYLVSYSSVITMMHFPINIRWNIHLLQLLETLNLCYYCSCMLDPGNAEPVLRIVNYKYYLYFVDLFINCLYFLHKTRSAEPVTYTIISLNFLYWRTEFFDSVKEPHLPHRTTLAIPWSKSLCLLVRLNKLQIFKYHVSWCNWTNSKYSNIALVHIIRNYTTF